ncbi:VanZ family protein [Priestia megaterium]|uniref:VanZ family protein n=1 Tax=Priestia megaterium TaxID=1404 RepID=UPI000BEDD1D2|nr:VanZ family protein [Priestia megaterium]MDH6651096.1 glycopeptide antibiotics resistance protein [Bacillus sp. PvP124]MDP9580548.1 glycopeptide antibiotics resistance protein [Bacillus sp. 1751]MED4067465.1 VanZ family protein [Priestia megaterium]PEA35621.1 teicoplanin resistance protein VanZ [Priestia megaterium]PFK43859.1 teicoplanin resistance protein VanZ [Priestia megaterium]
MEESMSIMFAIQSWYVLVPVSILGLIWLFSGAKRQKRKINLAQFAVLISFGIYLLCVIHLVFFPIDVNIGRYANQTPWYMTINFIPILTIDLTTFLLNVLMLIPFGMYVPFLNQTTTSFKRIAKLGFMLSLSFELLQLLIRVSLGSGRSSDINDLLANTAGAIIGFLIVKTVCKISPLKNMLKQFQL